MDEATEKRLFDVIRDIKGSGLVQSEVNAVKAALGLLPPLVGIKTTSWQGQDLIREFEGLSLKAYPDPATGGEPWTIGYGHTGDVKRGDVITLDAAKALLVQDLQRFERAVSQLCPIANQNQFDALVSFTYNLGEGNLKESTLRRLHNEGDYAGAKAQFARWNKANGKVMNGLTRRREAEARLYGL